MIEPWDLKQDDKREADTLPTFIIFCEDEVSEPIYFKFFETSLIKVNPVGKQKSKIENVVKAITHCVSQDLMIYESGGLKLIKDATHIWCVFDRDKEIEKEKISEGDVQFNTAIQSGKSAGIKIAWSNDAFELWILLHFQDIDPSDKSYIHRVKYYDELTDIFKKLENPNDDLSKALIHSGFGYKKDLKQKNNFRSIVREQMIPKTILAIERAKKLENFHVDEAQSDHQKAPCTMVHYLVEELLHYGKKQL